MPYKLRKSRDRDLYWVVNAETGKKYSYEALPKETAEKQIRLLYVRLGLEYKPKEKNMSKVRYPKDSELAHEVMKKVREARILKKQERDKAREIIIEE